MSSVASKAAVRSAARAPLKPASKPSPNDEIMVREADAFLSVLPPGDALALARRVAQAVTSTGSSLLYADCNAVSPNSVKVIGEVLTEAGAQFVDVGIIGGPPQPGRRGATTLYASGNHAAEFARLQDFGLDIKVLEGGIGAASGIKMCYAAMTKGVTAVATELLIAAERLGLSDALQAEFEHSQPDLLRLAKRQVPSIAPKAYRWVAEMQEIASTFGEVGLTPKIFEGAAELYRSVSETPAASEAVSAGRANQTADELVDALAATLVA